MTRLLPALTFVVGLLLGGLVVGVGLDNGSTGSDEPGATPSTDASTDPQPGDTESSPSDTTVRVPAACIEAAAMVEEALDLVRSGIAAVRDVQPDELISVLDELEALEPQARELARQCSAVEVSPSG